MHDISGSGVPGGRGKPGAISRRKVLAWAAGQIRTTMTSFWLGCSLPTGHLPPGG